MSGPRAVVVTLALIACAWLATLGAERTPAARPLDAAPTQFSGQRARALLQGLVGDNVPHPLGSPANGALRARIVAALLRLGLAPELQSGITVCTPYGVCGMPINILARIQGSDAASESAVLLCAHYDSVGAGPGASDNASGVAALLEIARVLQQLPRPRQSIILLFDDGEEVDLLGAHAFVEHHPWAKTVTAAVNLDARGTSGPSLMFETGSANRWLMSLYARAIARPLANSVYYAVYKLLPNDTDFTVFKAAGFQGFNFAFIGDVAHYHTPLDDLAHADAGSLQQQGDNALSTLLALANAGSQPPPGGEAVYFDLFGRMLVQMPQGWALPGALTGLLLALIAGAQLLRLRLLRVRPLLWGMARCDRGAADRRCGGRGAAWRCCAPSEPSAPGVRAPRWRTRGRWSAALRRWRFWSRRVSGRGCSAVRASGVSRAPGRCCARCWRWRCRCGCRGPATWRCCPRSRRCCRCWR